MLEYFAMPSAVQFVSALLTVLLAGLIGLERDVRGKDAGIRTNVLVGLGSYLFSAVSFYGSSTLSLGAGRDWDASRIAAQVVSGIGFLGAGVIFFHRDSVRGLTTAAAVWVTSSIGMACAANLFGVAIMIEILYFFTVLVFAPLVYRFLHPAGSLRLSVSYGEGQGVLRAVMLALNEVGVESKVLAASRRTSGRGEGENAWRGVCVTIEVSKVADKQGIVEELSGIDGVHDVEIVENAEE